MLEAALELFAERGYAGASARAITSRAGANVAAIKYYFGGKAGLYQAALQLAHARMLASTPDTAAAGERELDPEAALRAWVERGLRMAVRVRSSDPSQLAARLLMRAASEGASVPGLEDFVARSGQAMRAEVVAMLEALAPKASPEATDRAARMLLFVGTHFAEDPEALARFGLEPPTEPDALDAHLDTVWAFLRAGVLALLEPTP